MTTIHPTIEEFIRENIPYHQQTNWYRVFEDAKADSVDLIIQACHLTQQLERSRFENGDQARLQAEIVGYKTCIESILAITIQQPVAKTKSWWQFWK